MAVRSSSALKRMRRTYTLERYLDPRRPTSRRNPRRGAGTDLIVGFPGETEADFEATLAAVEEVGFDSAFTFIYSPRQGTEAAAMPEQVREELKHERLERLVDTVQRLAWARNRERIGRVEEVLVEGASRTDAALSRGRTRRNTTVNFSVPQTRATWSTWSSRARPRPRFAGGRVPSSRRDPPDSSRMAVRVGTRPSRSRDTGEEGIAVASSRGETVGGPGVSPREKADAGIEVVAVFGPTAAGKSAVAEALADRLGSDVVSADAMQVYRELPILTNQPLRPTRLVAICGVAETMSVGEYAVRAHAEIDELADRTGSVIVAGGTGLYLRAALVDLHLPPPAAPGVRAGWERSYDAAPVAAYEELRRRDPVAAEERSPERSAPGRPRLGARAERRLARTLT